MKNLNEKLGDLAFKGVLTLGLLFGGLNISQAQIKYDTLFLSRYNNYSPKFSYKTKENWDNEKLNLVVTNISIREDKLDSTKEMSQKCIEEVNLINNKWDKLNTMSLDERYNYFKKKYVEDFVPEEIFPYDPDYQYLSIFKEKNPEFDWSKFNLENLFYEKKREVIRDEE